MRFVEKGNARGSLKWIRHAVNVTPQLLNERIKAALGLPDSAGITWTSPLANDEYAEYRDEDFLRLTGSDAQKVPLSNFWPARGPQWDALAKLGDAGSLIVEAKANIPEVISPGTGAGGDQLALIEKSLAEVKSYMGIDPKLPWSGKFYQFANRLAHLYFLRVLNNNDAYLVFVYFNGDKDVDGPGTTAEWRAALTVAKNILGIPRRHPLSKYIAEVFIDISEIESGSPAA